MWQVLRNRDFFWLWTGQAVSLLGDGIRDWAVIYWVFQASGQSPMAQSLAFIAVVAPMLVVAPWAGVLVDRWDRRKVMIAADLVRAVLSLAKVGAVVTGQWWAVLVLVFAGSSAGAFFTPARSAMIPKVVGREQLVAANSLGQSTRTLMQLLDPAIGTGIYMLLGPFVSFTLDAVTFLVSAVCIAMIRVPGAVSDAAAGARPSFVAQFREGVHYAWSNLPIRAMIIGFTVVMMGAGAINTLTIFIATDHLGLPESVMSYFSTAQTATMLVVSLAVGSMAGQMRRTPLLIPLGILLAAVGVGVVALSPSILWMVAGAAVVGLGTGSLSLGVGVTLQALVPDNMRGRTFGVINSLPMGAMVASAAVAGWLAASLDVRWIVGGAALITLLAVPITFGGLKDVDLTAGGAQAVAGKAS